jgi:hypothetical protein
MKDALNRRAVVLTSAYWLGAPLIATLSARWQQPDGWFILTWFEFLQVALVYYVLPLSVLLWLGWAAARFSGFKRSVTIFTLFGVALPVAYHLAWQVPGIVGHQWHAVQLALARIEDVSDQTLLSEHGQPIGIRLSYTVTFPLGLSELGQQPPADAPQAGLFLPRDKGTLMYFVNRKSSLGDAALGGFRAGTTTITVDAVPAFMPLAIQFPSGFPPSVPGNLCFRWESAEGRRLQLAAVPQPALLDVGPSGRYVERGSRRTKQDYRLDVFYQGALAESAVECQ